MSKMSMEAVMAKLKASEPKPQAGRGPVNSSLDSNKPLEVQSQPNSSVTPSAGLGVIVSSNAVQNVGPLPKTPSAPIHASGGAATPAGGSSGPPKPTVRKDVSINYSDASAFLKAAEPSRAMRPDGQYLVELGEALARQLMETGVSITYIRGIYGMVQRLRPAKVPDRNRIAALKPRLAYMVAKKEGGKQDRGERGGGKGSFDERTRLYTVLRDCLDVVLADEALTKIRFEAFACLIESTVGYLVFMQAEASK